MGNFDFHNLLSPSEFENFCRDLLEIREKNIKFTTYRKGKDGGIDIKSTNTDIKIIGQCKLYNPNNYHSFFTNIKKEVIKCKRQKPDRYIVCTNINLDSEKAEKIKELFEGYILNEEDILDGQKLNQRLEQPDYEYLFKIYSRLLIPNFASIELALDQAIYRKYYNNTLTFLNDLKLKRKLYHYTNQIPFLIQKLEENKVIILSGNPGVGKTTTSKIIANYFLGKKVKDIIFLEERDYTDVLSIAKENQLIIIDDFWGQNFSPNIQKHSTYEREFQNIIKHFTESDNKFLILTSRDYIIKDILSSAEFETKKMLDYSEFIIKMNDFSFEDKLKIFLNHLLFYDFGLSYFINLKYTENLEYILKHKNYSPRLIEQFIKIYLDTELQKSSYIFFKSFYEYLEKPLDFWKIMFNKLSPTSQLILFILLVSGDEMNIEDLKNSFLKIQIEARHILNLNIIPSDFRNELLKLEEFYISINNNEYDDTKIIRFQSPGIKDYLLEYLRTDGYLWIQPIISNALFFNQLTFIFSTENEEISDYDSDLNLYGKKIVLNSDLKVILKEKLIKEFDVLKFSNYEEKDFTDQLSRFHNLEDIKYLKLLELNRFFDIEFDKNKDVRNFLINHIKQDFDNFQNFRKIVSHRSMIYFPSIIRKTFQFLQLTPQYILMVYYESITFSKEYEYFYDLKKKFPLEFENFYNENLVKIKTHIKELIFNDIDYYLSDDLDYEIDNLMFSIKELSKQYKFRVTKKFVKELELASERNLSYLLKTEKHSSRKSKFSTNNTLEKYKPKPFHRIINEFLPIEENYNPKKFLTDNKYDLFFKEVKNSESILYYFKNNQILFENFCEYIVVNNIKLENHDFYNLIDLYAETFAEKLNINILQLTNLFNKILNELNQADEYSITKSNLNTIIKSNNLALEISDLSPIILPNTNWLKFSNDYFEIYFKAKYISNLDDESFKNALLNEFYEPQELRLLTFLQSIDKKRLWKLFIIPEFKRLLKNIDFTNEKTKTTSFINFFKIEFDLEWINKDKSFETFCSSLGESHFEQLFDFAKCDFVSFDLEHYFLKYSQNTETIKRLKIDKQITPILVKLIFDTIKPRETIHILSDTTSKVYEIKLSEFINENDNFDIIKKIGMSEFVSETIEKVIKLTSDYK